jgi:hypothetical protein
MASSDPRSQPTIEPPRAALIEFASLRFSERDLAAADRTMAATARRFATLIADTARVLQTAWEAVPEPLDARSVRTSFHIAHDLAGCGATLGFPLVTLLARSMCRLVMHGDVSRSGMREVIGAHIDAIHAVIRCGIHDGGGEYGHALASALDQAIAKFGLGATDMTPGQLLAEVAALCASH